MAKPLSVERLSDYIQTVLRQDGLLSNVYVQGEVSDFVRRNNGHIYFSIKDQKASIRCVVFANMEIARDLRLKNGTQINVKGQITTYKQQSTYQILVKQVEEGGTGALYRQYEELKERLLQEGLFDQEHKRPLPSNPMKIGVVTSRTGAAVQDIVTTIKRRFWLADIYLYPASVQGDKAPPELIRALRYLDQLDLDLIIFGRGGGSFEDLNAFNNEELLRCIFDLKTPNISAVGHETDTMLSDYVADLRAVTPTAAAEQATPNLPEVLELLGQDRRRLHQQMTVRLAEEARVLDYFDKELKYYSPLQKIKDRQARLDLLARDLARAVQNQVQAWRLALDQLETDLDRAIPSRRLAEAQHRLAVLKQGMDQALAGRLKQEDFRLALLGRALEGHNLDQLMQRGFTMVCKGGQVVRSIEDLDPQDQVDFVLADGRVFARVDRKESL